GCLLRRGESRTDSRLDCRTAPPSRLSICQQRRPRRAVLHCWRLFAALLLGGFLLLAGRDLEHPCLGEAHRALPFLPRFLRLHLQNAFAPLEHVSRTDQPALALETLVDRHVIAPKYFH